ncbi:putative defective proboscis extension response, partial [Danaus plexippus plexippus]
MAFLFSALGALTLVSRT